MMKEFDSTMFLSPPPNLVDISEETRDRCHKLSQLFFDEWKDHPSFFCRAPGRVNLIGEHIDYMGFSVLPMAVSNDTLIAVGTPTDIAGSVDSIAQVDAINFDHRYSRASFQAGSIGKDGWHNYLACGVKGAIEDLGLSPGSGMRFAVHGNIPCASGLSSSSALVCAAALATYKVAEIASGDATVPSKLHIASICCKAERYIGTMGGGMDQVRFG
jgi:N-acetylgalactosamine kinase